jgi:SNF2 family DNA or RNA helicase
MDRFLWFLAKAGIDYKQHQYDGVQWAIDNECGELPVRGGFIADEMGLGKTITMIGTLIANFQRRTLIVLPNVLIQQWVSEILRTTGHMPLVYYGANKKKIDLAQLLSAPIVLTSYNAIAVSANDVDLPSECLMHQICWSRVVFDEAHYLRNKTSRYWGAKKLQSQIKWLMTGTPIQNKRRDFMNLCSVVGLPVSYYTNTENMEDLFEKHVLRRTKAQAGILLPELSVGSKQVLWKSEAERLLSEDIHCAISFSTAMDRLRLFIQARQACILPKMLQEKLEGLVEKHLVPRDHDHKLGLSCSSKMDAVIETLVERRGNGNGKLVFCHFRQEMDALVDMLRGYGITSIAVFDGRISMAARAKVLEEGYEYLVIQIKTGCDGLNLQADFSEVYFVSPAWNPAVEEQAIARCYRIGQVKPVQVFRFHMGSYEKESENEGGSVRPSLDQYVCLVQDTKREISNELFAM